MTITVDDLATIIQAECKDKIITDQKGNPIFGKIIVLSLNDGKVIHGECGQDVDIITRRTFKI
jgi:hypothetical protein